MRAFPLTDREWAWIVPYLPRFDWYGADEHYAALRATISAAMYVASGNGGWARLPADDLIRIQIETLWQVYREQGVLRRLCRAVARLPMREHRRELLLGVLRTPPREVPRAGPDAIDDRAELYAELWTIAALGATCLTVVGIADASPPLVQALLDAGAGDHGIPKWALYGVVGSLMLAAGMAIAWWLMCRKVAADNRLADELRALRPVLDRLSGTGTALSASPAARPARTIAWGHGALGWLWRRFAPVAVVAVGLVAGAPAFAAACHEAACVGRVGYVIVPQGEQGDPSTASAFGRRGLPRVNEIVRLVRPAQLLTEPLVADRRDEFGDLQADIVRMGADDFDNPEIPVGVVLQAGTRVRVLSYRTFVTNRGETGQMLFALVMVEYPQG